MRRGLVLMILVLLSFPTWALAGVIMDYSFDDIPGPWEKQDGVIVKTSDKWSGNLTIGSCYGNTLDKINAGANNPSGAGGMGYQFAVRDGISENGCTLITNFNALETHVKMRWFMRYPTSFNARDLIFTKWAYFRDMGRSGGMIMSIGDEYGRAVLAYGPSLRVKGAIGKGWRYINGGDHGDGRFHKYEVEVNMATGLVLLKVDDEIILQGTADYASYGEGWGGVFIPSNKGVVTIDGGGTAYIDIDDVLIVRGNEPLPPIPPEPEPEPEPEPDPCQEYRDKLDQIRQILEK